MLYAQRRPLEGLVDEALDAAKEGGCENPCGAHFGLEAFGTVESVDSTGTGLRLRAPLEEVLTKLEVLGLDGLGREERPLNFLRECLVHVARRRERAAKGIAVRAWAIVESDILLDYGRCLLIEVN